nr:phenolic glucoside malonyltransferase 1-like [Populus alba]
MAPQDSVKVLELCQVAPACNSPESVTNFSLPLTFLDIAWFKFPPAQQIIFYELTESSPTFFNLVILPRLKKSLSQALFHFLPLAGHLVWPENSQKPILLYTLNDAISLTIAESNADLSHLSGNETRQAIESFPYIPELPTSDTKASVIALQITLFPNKGETISSQLEKVHKEELKPTKQLDYMSTFVLTCAYTVVCMVKARGGDNNRKIYFIFSADCRGRLDPPIPQNYIGNCISSQHIVIKAGVSMEECGVAMIAERIKPGAEIIGVTGSTRFEDYSWDFGWGRPNKVEFTGNARGGVISLARSREGNGGVEIGLALKRHEMENLVSFFVNDLKNFAQISK